MKTFLLITTVLFTTPEKDFSGVVVQQFDQKVGCIVALEKLQEVNMSFGVMKVQILHKCEEKQ
jgi:hypothetical protein